MKLRLQDNTKKKALTVSGGLLALAMAIQTFVLGKNDIDTLKQEMTEIKTRVEALEGDRD